MVVNRGAAKGNACILGLCPFIEHGHVAVDETAPSKR